MNKSPKNNSSKIEFTDYLCNRKSRKRNLKVIKKKIQPEIDKKLNKKQIGIELKNLLGAYNKKDILPQLREPLSKKECYRFIGNYGLDYRVDYNIDAQPLNYGGTDFEDLVTVHIKYCRANYADDVIIRSSICEDFLNQPDKNQVCDSEKCLPQEFDLDNKNLFNLLRDKKVCNEEIDMTQWDKYSAQFTNQERNDYLENVLRFITNPAYDPTTNKKWDTKNYNGDKANIKINYETQYCNLPSFIKYFLSLLPLFIVLKKQFKITVENIKNVETYLPDKVFEYNRGKICKNTEDYTHNVGFVFIFKTFCDWFYQFLVSNCKYLADNTYVQYAILFE